MFRFLIFSIVLLTISSCNKEKLKSPESAFLVVNSANVFSTPLQGSNSSKITDIWYYVDDNFKGAFPIGSIMPIVGSGSSKITLYAGIKNNGISATRLPYDFYQKYTISQDITPGQTYVVNPTFEYLTVAAFPIIENFDAGGFKFMSVGTTPFTVITDPNLVYGGSGKSFYMTMTDVNPKSEIKTSTPINLPVGGAAVYLELNYKCNQQIEVGVIGGGIEVRQALIVNSSSEWNKIYIQLTSVVSTQPTYNYYDIYIKATKQVDSPEIYLDNIKLVTK